MCECECECPGPDVDDCGCTEGHASVSGTPFGPEIGAIGIVLGGVMSGSPSPFCWMGGRCVEGEGEGRLEATTAVRPAKMSSSSSSFSVLMFHSAPSYMAFPDDSFCAAVNAQCAFSRSRWRMGCGMDGRRGKGPIGRQHAIIGRARLKQR